MSGVPKKKVTFELMQNVLAICLAAILEHFCFGIWLKLPPGGHYYI